MEKYFSKYGTEINCSKSFGSFGELVKCIFWAIFPAYKIRTSEYGSQGICIVRSSRGRGFILEFEICKPPEQSASDGKKPKSVPKNTGTTSLASLECAGGGGRGQEAVLNEGCRR